MHNRFESNINEWMNCDLSIDKCQWCVLIEIWTYDYRTRCKLLTFHPINLCTSKANHIHTVLLDLCVLLFQSHHCTRLDSVNAMTWVGTTVPKTKQYAKITMLILFLKRRRKKQNVITSHHHSCNNAHTIENNKFRQHNRLFICFDYRFVFVQK